MSLDFPRTIRAKFKNLSDPEKKLDFSEMAYGILKKYEFQDNEALSEAVLGSLEIVDSAVRGYLQKVQDIETRMRVKLSDNGSPPRVFYETIEEAKRINKDSPEVMFALEELSSLETQKIISTIKSMDVIKQALEVYPPAEGKPLYVRILGSVIRGYIDFAKTYYGAEVNFCKNPKAKIPSSPALQS